MSEDGFHGAAAGVSEYLTFRLGDGAFCFATENILEIRDIAGGAAQAAQPTSTSFRGARISVVDLAGALQVAGDTVPENPAMIVIEIAAQWVGFVVSDLGDLIRIPASSVSAAAVTFRHPYVAGAFTEGSQTIHILDPVKIASDI